MTWGAQGVGFGVGAGGTGWGQGTSHRPVTGQICPLLAADRTSRATCSGEAGTGKKMEGRLSGGRNSDRTNPDQPRPPRPPRPDRPAPLPRAACCSQIRTAQTGPLCPFPDRSAMAEAGPSGAPSSRSSRRQNRRRPRAKIVAGRAPKGMPRAKSVQPAAVNLPRLIASQTQKNI
jgi:hypothetical protein